MTAALRRVGFDTGRLSIAVRTALAACLAVFLAWAAGLDHPQWAGMSVWAAAQPMRGALLEKSLFRVLGTMAGSLAGVALILGAGMHPWLLVAGLALWVGACTWLGNLQRGFVAYGTVLAGYTAAMVALLDPGQPGSVLALGLDRMASVLTGVAVGTLVGLIFAPGADVSAMRHRMRLMLADLMDMLAQDPAAVPAARRAEILSRVAELDEALDPHAAGSLRSRREVRSCREMLMAALSLLYWQQGSSADLPGHDALSEAAAALRADDDAAAAQALARAARGLDPEEDPGLGLAALARGLPGLGATRSEARQIGFPVQLHRDRIGAAEAGLRAAGALLVSGALWQLSGIAAGAYLMLGLSVMISLFSTFENPARLLRFVWIGQGLGVLGALAVRWLAWPFATSELQMVLMLMPFILIGPFLVGHRRTLAVAFDYNMVLLLMLQPQFPPTGSLAGSLLAGLAVVAAPLIAMVAYLLVYPPTLRRKIGAVLGMIRRDLADLTRRPDAEVRLRLWRARFYHRSLRLVRMTETSAAARADALAASASAWQLGRAAMLCRQLVDERDQPEPVTRAAAAVLAAVRAPMSDDAVLRRPDPELPYPVVQHLLQAGSGLERLMVLR